MVAYASWAHVAAICGFEQHVGEAVARFAALGFHQFVEVCGQGVECSPGVFQCPWAGSGAEHGHGSFHRCLDLVRCVAG
jgi:hypothetical protein